MRIHLDTRTIRPNLLAVDVYLSDLETTGPTHHSEHGGQLRLSSTQLDTLKAAFALANTVSQRLANGPLIYLTEETLP